jgi:hypothetical protein
MADALRGGDVTSIYATEALFRMWRASPRGETSALAAQWSRQYPGLFDQDDLDLIVNQACDGYHFAEWYAAIHLFVRDGARSVIEKYDTYENHYHDHRQKTHLYKISLYESAVPEEHRALHHEICSRHRVQLPDLLVLAPDGSYGFAEVKGPTDGTINSPKQVGMRNDIRSTLGVRAEVISVALGGQKGGG